MFFYESRFFCYVKKWKTNESLRHTRNQMFSRRGRKCTSFLVNNYIISRQIEILNHNLYRITNRTVKATDLDTESRATHVHVQCALCMYNARYAHVRCMRHKNHDAKRCTDLLQPSDVFNPFQKRHFALNLCLKKKKL